MRDRGVKTAGAPIQDNKAIYTPKPQPTRIDVLVENIGRVNYGHQMPTERKGMTALTFGIKLYGCGTRTLPLDDLSRLAWRENSEQAFAANKPLFLRGEFEAKAGVDSYVHFEVFSHGYIWINGFSLGRYDSCGPQMTLYLPGSLLQESGNVIEVLDVLPTKHNASITLIDHHILEGDAVEMS
jgi:beta-galactosidase